VEAGRGDPQLQAALLSVGEEGKSAEKKDKSQAKKIYSKDSLQDLKNRKRLLADEPALLEQVRATMGSRYHDAVRACIGSLEYFKLPTEADETS
jgi:hypothetical protein